MKRAPTIESREAHHLAMRPAAFNLFLSFLLSTLILPSMTQAAPGDLDPTFGTGGKVITGINGEDYANAVAIQPDGKIVVAGESYPLPGCCDTRGFALARYNPDGSLDTTFGTGGKVITSFNYDDSAHAVAIQPDGKIVAVGTTYDGYNRFALARYNPDGSLDGTFGTGGKVITGLNAYDIANAVAIQPDGKIVVAGETNPLPECCDRHAFALVRYNPDGSLDPTFGTGGKVITGFNGWEFANAVAIQPDGKIVAVGTTLNGPNHSFVLARYNTDGSLDPTFGTGGKVITGITNGEDCSANAVAIQPDGKIVVAGETYYRFALARYNPDGSLDATFGTGGKVITSFSGEASANAVAIQPDGKIVAVGTNDGDDSFALARYNTNGSLDTSFGAAGKVMMPASDYSAKGALIQPDGKIVAAGTFYDGNDSFALARYLVGDPPSAVSLTPVNIVTAPSVAQSFTAVFSNPNGWQNISDASLALSGSTHNEVLHYSPATNKFTLVGASGDCSPGNGATLTNGFLNLNCGASNISGSGNTLTVTINLTPQPPLSGAGYRLVLSASDQGGANVNKDMGYWVVNRPPHADSVTPMNSTTPIGTQQTFTAVYSDPDGYQNIAEASFYLAGGMHNEWLHYIPAANIFFIMGGSGVCTPGQATTLSNGFLTLDCATSSVLGSGTTLTITFRVTPQAPSAGINYNIFTGASDHAGAAHGLFAGTWQIQ